MRHFMKSLIIFLAIQLFVYILSISSVMTISLIVLGSAVALFAGAYVSAHLKDRSNRRKTVNAALELQ